MFKKGNKSCCTKNSTQNTYIIICKYFLNWYNERRKTNFIIFDEPTASLDPSAEKEMYQNLQKIIGTSNRGRGCIFISHRLASAKMADIIFVLDEGRIIERGYHDELIKNGGLYSKMYKEQASWYKNEPDTKKVFMRGNL